MTHDKRKQLLDDFFALIQKRTGLMGILNATPDSFSDGGQFNSAQDAVQHGVRMVTEGADIIDVGGESTRPGAYSITIEEEIERICPVISGLANVASVPISVDTMKAKVAEAALEAGACLVNDISGLQNDPGMPAVVARYVAGLAIMHMRGSPRTMQQNTHYDDLCGEICEFLSNQATLAITAGVNPRHIVLDPGFGFSKTPQQNMQLIRDLSQFCGLGYPVLIGVSRKSTLGFVANHDEGPLSRRESTAAALALAIDRGANLVRVHDVGLMGRAVRVADAITKLSPSL